MGRVYNTGWPKFGHFYYTAHANGGNPGKFEGLDHVKPNEKSEDRYLIEVTMDFGSVSAEDRLAMAANTAWITIQRRWRSAFASNPDAALTADRWSTVDVHRDLTAAPRTADPVTKAMRAIDKLDDVTRDAVLQRYLDEQKGTKKKAA